MYSQTSAVKWYSLKSQVFYFAQHARNLVQLESLLICESDGEADVRDSNHPIFEQDVTQSTNTEGMFLIV